MKGKVVLVPFPFIDLSASKLRQHSIHRYLIYSILPITANAGNKTAVTIKTQ